MAGSDARQTPAAPPLFSIITPVYNSVTKIGRTIRSVLDQRDCLLEYIVVDGDSVDGTAQIIARYADNERGRLRFLSEPDDGVYHAMNKAITMARGKYLLFLGAGDALRAGALSNVAGLLPADKLALAYGNVFWKDKEIIYNGEFTKQMLRTHNICHQAIFYTRDIFRFMGGYDVRYEVLADYVFNIRCFAEERITKRHIDYVVADFEGGGLSAQVKDEILIAEHAALIKQHLE